MSDLERARQAVEKQQREADRRVTVAARLGRWYRTQLDENNWRKTVERLVRDER